MSVRDFPPRPQGATPDSVPYQNWLDALGQRQNIDLQQELTSVDSADELLIFDASETGPVKTKKATVSNVGSTIAGAGHAGSFTTLTATGLVDISASGAGQIKFPATQNASSDANTLDDYEEGTWTPVDASGAGLSLTVSGAVYQKVGNTFSVFSRVQYPATASGANASIGGLPFTCVNANGASAGILGYTTSATAFFLLPVPNTTTINIYNSAGAQITNAAMSSSVNFFSGFSKAA